MAAVRLELALQSGALVVPATGQIAVYAPQPGADFSMFDKERLRLEVAVKPDHAGFALRGFRMGGQGPDAVALVCLPRARAYAHALMHRAMAALAPGGVMVLDGQKLDGIEAAVKELRGLGLPVSEAISKAHGKLVVLAKADLPAEWAEKDRDVDGFITRPGVFSADGADRGSALLAAALPAKLPSHMADLGAGWGYLGRAVLARAGVKSLDLVEADARALDCARINLADERVRFLWEDATTYKPPKSWGGVVMNPPFHASRSAEPALGLAFLRAAHRGLTPDGQLWAVFNRHLPYGPLLAELFHKVEDIGTDSAFRLIRAEGLKRDRKA